MPSLNSRRKDELCSASTILWEKESFVEFHIVQKVGACPETLISTGLRYPQVCCARQYYDPLNPMVKQIREGLTAQLDFPEVAAGEMCKVV